MFGREPQTLMNYKSVAGSVQSYLRKDNLSWNHHKEVAKLTEQSQSEMLSMAMPPNGSGKAALSVRELRNAVRQLQVEQIHGESIDTGEFGNVSDA